LLHTANSRITELNQTDINKRFNIEKAGNGSDSSLSGSDILRPTATLEPTATSDNIILSFTDDDPENPYTWKLVSSDTSSNLAY